jgi:hypothetical protein
MLLPDEMNIFPIVGEITICTEAAVKEGEVIGTTVFVAKRHPDVTREHVEMSLINSAILTSRAMNTTMSLFAVLHVPVEGFEDLGGFKRISANIGAGDSAFTLEASAQTDEPKRVKIKIIMLFEQEGRKRGEMK